MRHLDLGAAVQILEISSIPFSGTVYFPAVAPYFLAAGATVPTVWPFSDTPKPARCVLGAARVCLKHFHGDDELACVSTKADGTYVLPAPVRLANKTKVCHADSCTARAGVGLGSGHNGIARTVQH